MVDLPIYFDYAATTPVDPRVAHRMGDSLTATGNFGNPASNSHVFGWRAAEAVENARSQVAAVLQADPREIVWTSGASESDNLALKGIAELHESGHFVTSSIEHKAILDTCEWLETRGFEITYLPPNADGTTSPDAVSAALRPDTRLVSIMHVNNELGCINDVAAIGAVCREAGVLFHTDAAQSFGKLPIDVRHMPIDMLSVSGHKIYGPKGIGALFVRREPPIGLKSQIHGGGHERGMRSGTLPTHQIVGIGEAAELMVSHAAEERARLTDLRGRFLRRVTQLPDISINGSETDGWPGIVNMGFGGVDGETLVMALDDLAISTGSACNSESVEPSFVLQALKVPPAIAHASLRFSMGRFTTEAEVEHAGTRVVEVVERLRGA